MLNVFSVWHRMLYYIACSAPIALYQYYYVNSFYPIDEGWFTAYARLIRLGYRPYIDFNLVLTPLYPMLIAGYQAVFGETFFVLHVAGTLLTCLKCVILFEIYATLFNAMAAAIAAIVTIVYYQNFIVYLNYDFPMIMMVFAFLSAMCIMYYVKNAETDVAGPAPAGLRRLCLVGGFFLGCAIMTKHSIAAFTPIATVAVIALVAWRRFSLGTAVRHAFWFCLGVGIPILLLLLYVFIDVRGDFQLFISSVVSDSIKSKGGLRSILTAFVKNFFLSGHYLESTLQSTAEFLVLLALVRLRPLLAFLRSALKSTARFRLAVLDGPSVSGLAPEQEASRQLALTATFTILVCLLLYARSQNWLLLPRATALVNSLFFNDIGFLSANMMFFGFAVALYATWRRKAVFWAQNLLLFSLGISYILCFAASMHSIHVVSTALGVGFVLAFVLTVGRTSLAALGLVFALLLFALNAMIESKFSVPYSWWSLHCPDVRSGCLPGKGLFSGMCLPPGEQMQLERLAYDIERFTSPTDAVYVYPHIPVLNVLTDRLPYGGAVQSWFDFSGHDFVRSLAGKLAKDPPPVIVMVQIPWNDFYQHERLFSESKSLPQRQVLQAVEQLVVENRIVLIDKIDNLNGYTINVYARTDRLPDDGSVRCIDDVPYVPFSKEFHYR